MLPGISTHLFLPQRLSPSLLDTLHQEGIAQIEVFAARHHFDYTDRAAVRELSNWFRSNNCRASLHMPLFAHDDEAQWSRHTAPSLNLISLNKADRIAAMDEVKRALESAEQVPFRSCVLHLGLKDDKWNTRALDDALTAVEHLKAFAGPLGVQLLLENLPNDFATPAHLVEIVRMGHFHTVGFCLDLGHAALAPAIPETSDGPAQSGIDQALAAFSTAGADKLVELHLHDNNGARDEHLWPGDGTIDFTALPTLPAPAAILEIAYDLGESDARQRERIARAAERFRST